jgi:hypothetical protein
LHQLRLAYPMLPLFYDSGIRQTFRP